jgi:hypothetical protein
LGAALALTIWQPAWSADQPPACAAPEHHQFDFWIGRWDVFDTRTGARAGASVIEGVYGGCAVRENWSEDGFTGGSLNAFTGGQWRQTWTDSSGAWREFVGSFDGGRMVLVSSHPSARFPGRTAHERIAWSVNADGSVRQYSDATIDEGKTWVLRYDYTYRPARSAP